MASYLRGGGGPDEGVLPVWLEGEPAELRLEHAPLRSGGAADGGVGVRGVGRAVVDVHCEREEAQVGGDEERHQEREPPPERPEVLLRRARAAAPVLVAMVSGAVGALGPPAVRVDGDHRRLAPPRHCATGEGREGLGVAHGARGMRAIVRRRRRW